MPTKMSSKMKRKTKPESISSDKRTAMGLNQRFVDTLGWLITFVWAASMIVHALGIGYEPPASIHLLMMLVAGAAFGTNLIKPKNGDNNDP